MPSPTAPAKIEIRPLTLLQVFMLAYVGGHRRRAQPVYLPELRRACLPHPIEEQVDQLGEMGLTRNAWNREKRPIIHSVFVAEVGWLQLFSQHKRVISDARRHVVTLRTKADSTRKPEDSKRKPDPNGADDFERQAKQLEDFIGRVERLVTDVLEDAPIATSDRQRLALGDGYAVSEQDDSDQEAQIDPGATQMDSTNEDEDAADPKLLGRVRVTRTDGNDGLTDMTDDAKFQDGVATDDDAPPAPRPRGRRKQRAG